MKKILFMLVVFLFSVSQVNGACKVKDIMTGGACSLSKEKVKFNNKNFEPKIHKRNNTNKTTPYKKEPRFNFKNLQKPF